MYSTTHPAPAHHVDAVIASADVTPDVADELRVLADDPGAYPLRRLARALDDGAAIPSADAGRRAAELRDLVLSPLPVAPDRPAEIVDELLAAARREQRSEPYAYSTALRVEYRIRCAIETLLGGLPTAGGVDRDLVADRIGHYVEALRVLTRRMTDGTADIRLYSESPDPDA